MNQLPFTSEQRASHEAARLDALRRLDLLDTPPSEAFDRITRMAAQVFGLPIAAVSLTDSDRQWFKSRVGIDHSAIPRHLAPCSQVAESSTVLVIPDLLADPVFKDSRLARNGVRFYAGAPLLTRDGFDLGAMCVLGMEPRQASLPEIASLRDLAAMVMSQIELQHAIGRVDPLSGLPNRTQFIEDFDDLVKDRPQGEARLAILVSLASAAQLNDAARAMGSAYLDQMVAQAASWIRQAIGPQRKVYHVAATQFVMLAPPGAGEREYSAELAEWLDAREHSDQSRFVTTTAIGVAPFRLGETGCLDVLRTAHSAAQDAFESGRRVSVYSSTQDAAYQRRFSLLNEFGAALESPGQLRLVYQPRIDLASGRCCGAEALLRWSHPLLGEVAPGEFIPVIEQTSMARATTAWVLEAALQQQARWRASGLALQVSVNVAPVNLLEPDFAARVIAGLARHGLPAAALELEITESAIMENPKIAHATLEALAAAGVHLAIDDFGTGYSSLSYLQSMPAHVVKIDQSFMRELMDDERRRALVVTMISLCHDLGYRVVAEGVETAAVRDFVRSAGCDEAQGYLFARPLPADELVAWSSRQQPRSSGSDPVRGPTPVVRTVG